MGRAEVDKLARTIWDYHHVRHRLKKADAILVLTSHDPRVAEYAARLFREGLAPLMIFSGTGIGHRDDLLATDFGGKTEAEYFAEIAARSGVPRKAILTEKESRNVGENFAFTGRLLSEKGIKLNSVIVVQKPYMERRAWATGKKWWPDAEIIVTSSPLTFEEYPSKEITKNDVINIMVGDLQRVKLYAERGFQIPQEIPAEVWAAYEQLVALGYTKHLIK